VAATYTKWIEQLAERGRFGPRDRKGTANLIDGAARERAARAMTKGTFASLARPLDVTDGAAARNAPLSVDVSVRAMDAFLDHPPFVGGHLNFGSDVLHVRAHGQQQTHLDAINHVGRRDEWYSGFGVDDPDGPSLADLGRHGLFTRGVLVDIPELRRSDWVDAGSPVTGEEIDAALDAGGLSFEPGDALLLYMGRDKFEAAGHIMDATSGLPTPGAGSSTARWLVQHEASILCWDFLDAVAPSEPALPVHLLIWAVGLLLVDNCELSAAAQLVRQSGSPAGALVVAPPAIPGATGALVHPLFIQ
jgi:kynurenine formamidase